MKSRQLDANANLDEPVADSAGYAWFVAILLMLVQVVSYVDRFLPSLLLESIKDDLRLSDFQVGLLIGPAFGIFYVVIGLPLGWLADRFSRRNILAIGIAIWSLMTAAGCRASGFGTLFAARLGVGLGEAAVAPCAVSLISDYFPRRTRAKALSVFMAGTFLGAGTAFLLGGPLVHAIIGMGAVAVPGVGLLAPWQLAFLILGLPGLLMALAVLLIREPARREQVTSDRSLGSAVRYVRTRWRAFGTLFIASASCVTLGSLSLWNVSLFARTWAWDVRSVGVATGLLFFTGGPVGTVLGIRLTARGVAAGKAHATLRTVWIGLLIGVPGFALYPVMPTPELALVAMFFAFVGQATAAAGGPAALSFIAPGEFRSQLTAIYYLVISFSGQLLGPPPVGWLTDALGGPAMLRVAMMIEALTVGVPACIIVWFGMRSFGRQVAELESALDR